MTTQQIERVGAGRAGIRRAAAHASLLCSLLAIAVVPAGPAQSPALSGPALTAQLQAFGVPGAVVVEVRNCQVAAVTPLGQSAAISGEPVTAQTSFQAASLGKVPAALMALQTMRRLGIDIDAPIAGLPLQPPELAARVTPSQLLSHSSGLGNSLFPLDTTIRSEPGLKFAYSGVGFEVLGTWLSTKTGESVDALASGAVFGPLSMNRSRYAGGSGSTAHGRAAMAQPAMIAGVMMTAVAAVLALFASLGSRLLRHRWLPPRRCAWAIALTAAAVVVAVLGAPMGTGVALQGIAAALVPLLLASIVGLGLARLLRGRGRWRLLAGALGAAAGFAAGASALTQQVPVLDNNWTQPRLAYSWMTNGEDLGRLIVTLLRPPAEFSASVAQMRSPVVRFGASDQWGRGIGLRTGPGGEQILWQWGANLGYRGLLVAIPDRCAGVGVLTNSDNGDRFAAYVAREALGLEGPWRAQDVR